MDVSEKYDLRSHHRQIIILELGRLQAIGAISRHDNIDMMDSLDSAIEKQLKENHSKQGEESK
jgi:hypothetical protein